VEQPQGRARQRAYTFGVVESGDELSELRELLRTAGVATVGEMVQVRDRPHPNVYLGPGKVAELKAAIKRADANLAVADDELTPRQQRNLETELDVPVLDRTSVILDIFAGHANTAEGKLQVELAQLEYNMARMRGLWTHLERLGAGRGVGGIGTRGPGESQIETDRRLARNRISALRRRLEEVKATRSVMRAERERAHLPTVALAGYTNAGKSTLLNALTGAEVSVRDRLFHTLDPTTRTWRHEGRTYLITDTVGFIRKLPHNLVEAFAATLEETIRADLVLHVVDASAPEAELDAMLSAVEEVLEEIGAGDAPRLLVLNKADAVEDRDALLHRGGVLVSALTGEGLEELGARIVAEFEKTLVDVDLLVPFGEGGVMSELHELAGDLEREDTAEGVRVAIRLPRPVAARFDRFSLNGNHA
jgi:GTPase